MVPAYYPAPCRAEDVPTAAEVRAMESPEPLLLRNLATRNVGPTIARPRGELSHDTLSIELGLLAVRCAASHPHIAEHLHELSKLVGVDLFLADAATTSFVQAGTVHDEREARTARAEQLADLQAAAIGATVASEQVTAETYAREQREWDAIWGEDELDAADALAARAVQDRAEQQEAA